MPLRFCRVPAMKKITKSSKATKKPAVGRSQRQRRSQSRRRLPRRGRERHRPDLTSRVWRQRATRHRLCRLTAGVPSVTRPSKPLRHHLGQAVRAREAKGADQAVISGRPVLALSTAPYGARGARARTRTRAAARSGPRLRVRRGSPRASNCAHNSCMASAPASHSSTSDCGPPPPPFARRPMSPPLPVLRAARS